MRTTFLSLNLALSLSWLALFAEPATAQDAWPTKPLRFVVGFSAGGPTDIVARSFAEQATRDLGQVVVVDNKPGANSIIAAELVASSTDQHTFLVAATNHAMIPALYSSQVKYDAVKSFAPVCTLFVAPTVLVVGSSSGVKTLDEFVQKAAKSPDSVSYGSSGIGSSSHFAGEAFAKIANVKMTHIPYKGANQIVTDLMGGRLDASFTTLGSVLSHAKSGRLEILAIASDQRHPELPSVPTFDEAGIHGYRVDAWYGLLAPANVSAVASGKLQDSVRKYLSDQTVIEKFRAQGLNPLSACGPAFSDLLEGDVKTYVRLAEDLGVRQD